MNRGININRFRQPPNTMICSAAAYARAAAITGNDDNLVIVPQILKRTRFQPCLRKLKLFGHYNLMYLCPTSWSKWLETDSSSWSTDISSNIDPEVFSNKQIAVHDVSVSQIESGYFEANKGFITTYHPPRNPSNYYHAVCIDDVMVNNKQIQIFESISNRMQNLHYTQASQSVMVNVLERTPTSSIDQRDYHNVWRYYGVSYLSAEQQDFTDQIRFAVIRIKKKMPLIEVERLSISYGHLICHKPEFMTLFDEPHSIALILMALATDCMIIMANNHSFDNKKWIKMETIFEQLFRGKHWKYIHINTYDVFKKELTMILNLFYHLETRKNNIVLREYNRSIAWMSLDFLFILYPWIITKQGGTKQLLTKILISYFNKMKIKPKLIRTDSTETGANENGVLVFANSEISIQGSNDINILSARVQTLSTSSNPDKGRYDDKNDNNNNSNGYDRNTHYNQQNYHNHQYHQHQQQQNNNNPSSNNNNSIECKLCNHLLFPNNNNKSELYEYQKQHQQQEQEENINKDIIFTTNTNSNKGGNERLLSQQSKVPDAKQIVCSFHRDFIPNMNNLYKYFAEFGKIINKLFRNDEEIASKPQNGKNMIKGYIYNNKERWIILILLLLFSNLFYLYIK